MNSVGLTNTIWGAMFKLILLAYSYRIFSSRKIERFARENKAAGWLLDG